MGKLEDEVAALIEFRYGSRAEFARSIRIPEQTLYSVLNHSLVTASFSTVMPIVHALTLDPIELMNGRLAQAGPSQGAVDVPLFSTIAFGQAASPQTTEGTFPIPAALHEAYPDAFMLRMRGTSMNRILPDGHYALIDPCDDVSGIGGLYAIAIGQEPATVKNVRLLSNGMELQPNSDDPTHHAAVFDYADSKAPEVHVVGRVVWHCPPVQVD